VQISVKDGIATLSGSVSNILAKERAQRVSETIKGVRSIVDQVTVTPIARTDSQLKLDVERAMHDDIATRPHTIDVASANGKVTLSGTADSWQQKKMFAEVTEEVPGVKALDNAIVVHYSATRPDSEILADVNSRFDNDVWLDGDHLAVTVKDRIVHVSGIVGSVAQRERARSDGWVAGVDGVDTDAVEVDWFAKHDQREQAQDHPLKSDTQVGQAVRDAFQLDPRLKPLVPEVAVHNGAVVLSGIVSDAKARLAAEADARETVGVWSVRDKARVQPGGSPTDADIVRAIKRLLANDALVTDGNSLQVSIANGKVELKGTVTSSFDRMNALADVGRVPGVAEIDDQLIVQRPPEEIRASIDDRLSWDPMVQRDRVSVAMAPNGDATLTGTVDDWSEIKAATSCVEAHEIRATATTVTTPALMRGWSYYLTTGAETSSSRLGCNVISMGRLFARPGGRIVASNRVELTVTRAREALRFHPQRHEQFHDLNGTRGRELPVRREASCLNGYVFRMTGHLEAPTIDRLQDTPHASESPFRPA
jgi:osmotically-inducible protein OsmY